MPQKKLIRQYLDKVFPWFEENLKDHISSVGKLKIFKAGEVLPNKKSYLNSVWLVADGNVKVYYETAEGKEVFMYMVGPGEACALSMLDQRHSANASMLTRTLEPTEIIQVSVKDLEEFMLKYSTWNAFLLDTCKVRFDSLLNLVENLKFNSLEQRLEKYLKDTVKKLGRNQINITHQEIANDLNSSREVVTRILKKMENKGMLKYNRHNIEWLG